MRNRVLISVLAAVLTAGSGGLLARRAGALESTSWESEKQDELRILVAKGEGQNYWPNWRGPSGQGLVEGSGYPDTWSDTEDVLWKVPVPGRGHSSPIIWRNQIFLTTASNDGTRLTLLSFDRGSGKQLWATAVPFDRWEHIHTKNSHASATPVTDGDRLFAWFGTGQLVALDLEGHKLWSRHIGQDYAPFDVLWGHGSSPQLYEDLLILQCDHPAAAYLLALDTATGEERWMVDRGPLLRAYSTPLVVATDDGDQLIVNSSRWIDAYDPRTGQTRWRAGSTVELATGMPVYDDGVIYSTRGYSSGPYLSVETGGRGDVSETHVRWRHATRAPYVSSMLLYRGLLYMATENGILTITDPDTGDPVARTRLNGVYIASPVAADGHVYVLNEDGETVVLEAGPDARVVSRNALGERALASPAIAHGRIYIRTDQHLFAIGPD